MQTGRMGMRVRGGLRTGLAAGLTGIICTLGVACTEPDTPSLGSSELNEQNNCAASTGTTTVAPTAR